jgi:hypothetical protein
LTEHVAHRLDLLKVAPRTQAEAARRDIARASDVRLAHGEATLDVLHSYGNEILKEMVEVVAVDAKSIAAMRSGLCTTTRLPGMDLHLVARL